MDKVLIMIEVIVFLMMSMIILMGILIVQLTNTQLRKIRAMKVMQ